ncbi:MAG: helix-turn-helix transcriptional regulator, partial [Clostridia bacterium]|nr:helix-turn-helix transcriptional regulator [Clostridia bacterium]
MYDLNHIYKVGNLISKLREEKGLSQSELGSLLGVTNKAVSRWENGRGYPDTSLLLKLSDVLEITVDELLKGELSTSAKAH